MKAVKKYKNGGKVKVVKKPPIDPPKYNTAPASTTDVNIRVPVENVQLQLDEPVVAPAMQSTLSQGPRLSPSFREIMTYGPGQQTVYDDAAGREMPDDYYEPFIENLAEFFDPTGAVSHDDAYAAYERMKARGADTPNFDEALDMFGAIPLVGKAKQAFVLAKGTRGSILLALQKAKVPFNKFLKWADYVNKGDAVEDETDFLNKFQDWLKTVPSMSDNSGNTSPTIKMANGGKITKSSSSEWYAKNGTEKKDAYNKEYHSTSVRKKYRALLNRKNREMGTYGNGDKKDVSHKKDGGVMLEHQSKNRARNRGKA